MCYIPDGLYSLLDSTLQILANSKRSASDLRSLIDALNKARANNASPEEVKATLNEHAPELKAVADTLSQKNRNELYAAIQALCAVITAFTAVAALYISTQGITKEQIGELIDKALTGDVKIPKVSRPVIANHSRPQPTNRRLSRAKRKAAKARSQQRAKH